MADDNVAVSGIEDNHNKSSKKNKLIYLALFLVVIGITVVTAQILSNRNQLVVPPGTAFVVDGKSYSKDSINKMIDATDTGNDQAARDKMAKSIYNMYITQAASQKAKITPSNSEQDSAKAEIGGYDSSTGEARKYNDLVAYNNALQNSYSRYQKKQISGWVFVFNYGRNIMDFSALKPEASKPDPEKYKADKQYAKNLADANYEKIKKSSISNDQLAKDIEADNRVNYLGLTTNFTVSNGSTIEAQVPNNEITRYIKSQNKKGLSSIMQGRLYASAKNREQVDAFYYFVKIDEIKPAIKNPSNSIQKKSSSMKNKFYGIN